MANGANRFGGLQNALRPRCFAFNLVEIVLAMAVLAIGISSVLVLFPVGVNANRDAVAGNNMADLSETILAAVRSNVDAGWYSWKKNKTFKYVKLDGKALVQTGKEPETNLSEADAASSQLESDATMIMLADGVILFRQLSKIVSENEKGTKETIFVPEFSAIARVWEDNSVLNNALFVTKGGFKSSPDGLGDMSKAVHIEISWPANLNYADREKAHFFYESFNDNYEPFATTNSEPKP